MNAIMTKGQEMSLIWDLSGLVLLQEPVELWRNVGGQNLFNDMISQPHRWMTTFQLYSTMTR